MICERSRRQPFDRQMKGLYASLQKKFFSTLFKGIPDQFSKKADFGNAKLNGLLRDHPPL